MRKFVVILWMLFISTYIYAAGPITHVFIAEKWLQYNSQYDQEQTAAFFVGTLFPDIRYMAKISRNKTHFKGLKLEDIKQAPNAFRAGLNLHCYLDEAREKMVIENHVYDLFKDFPPNSEIPSLLKLLEDEILFSKIDKDRVIECLLCIPEEELNFDIKLEIIRDWHELQACLLTYPPSEILKEMAAYNQPYLHIKAETVQLWNARFAELLQNPEIQKHVQNLEQKFEQEFSKFATNL